MIIQTMEIDHTQWAAWNLKKKIAFNLRIAFNLKILENYQRTYIDAYFYHVIKSNSHFNVPVKDVTRSNEVNITSRTSISNISETNTKDMFLLHVTERQIPNGNML